jgi:hypothetical protein
MGSCVLTLSFAIELSAGSRVLFEITVNAVFDRET